MEEGMIGDIQDYESSNKKVSHPDHYQSKSGMEVIDVIENFTEDLVGKEAVLTGNAIKYILRWKKKNGVEDVEKAIWYLTRLRNWLMYKDRVDKIIVHGDEETQKNFINAIKETEFKTLNEGYLNKV